MPIKVVTGWTLGIYTGIAHKILDVKIAFTGSYNFTWSVANNNLITSLHKQYAITAETKNTYVWPK